MDKLQMVELEHEGRHYRGTLTRTGVAPTAGVVLPVCSVRMVHSLDTHRFRFRYSRLPPTHMVQSWKACVLGGAPCRLVSALMCHRRFHDVGLDP
jgi:hypothetical protein